MKQKFLLKTMLLLCALIVGSGTMWADVVSGTTYSTPSIDNLPEGWSGEDGGGTSYIKLIESDFFIQTSQFGQDGFTSITLKARKFGGPSANQAQITVSWYSNDTETVLGTISPTSTTLTNYTISSPSNPTGNTTGYIKIQCKGASSSKGSGVSEVTINYTAASGGGGSSAVATTTTIDASGITNTDVYTGTEAGSLAAIVKAGKNTVDGATVTWSGDNDDVATIDEETGAVTLIAAGTVTFTATYAGVKDEYESSSDTYELTVTDSTPIPTHTATFSVNGVTSTQDFEEGAAITFPNNPADVEGKTFMGWVTEIIDGTTNEAPTFVTSATMGESDVTYYAVFAFANGGGSSEVVDVLNRALTGVTGTSYASWTGKTATSSAVYAGQSAGGNESIQLRSNNNNSGIVTTTSGGKAKKVTITWNSNTDDARKVDVYGKNTAYSAASDLYSTSTQGTKLGTIQCSDNADLTINDDYEYIGLRSNSGALYLDEVNITWSTGGGVTYSDYCTTVVAAAVARPTIEVAENPFLFSTKATITCETEDAAIKYSFDGDTWNNYEEDLTITETTTIYAKAVKNEDESEVASVVITKNLATPIVAVSGDLEVDLNGETDVEAGILTATVTYEEEAVDGATVTWSSSNTDVATIDESTGVVTIKTRGTAIFTATYAGNSDYAEATGTKTITVIDSQASGSEAKPYKVSEITAEEEGVYVQGIISSITEVSTQYHNATYKISEDGTTTNEFTVFRGKYLDNANFTSADQISVGDAVVIYGNITTYNTQLQLNQGNYLVSLVRKVATPTFNPESGELMAGSTVTISTTTEDATIYYTVDGTEPTTESTEYTEAITINEDMTIKAIAVKDGMTNSDVATATYTIIVTPTITINTSSIEATAAETEGSVAIAYSNLDISATDDFDVQYYDSEGEETDAPNWILVEVAKDNGDYVVSYMIDANDGEARTAYFKVYAMDNEEFVYSNLVTVSQDAVVVTPPDYVRITSLNQLVDGCKVIIAARYDEENTNGYYAMPSVTSGKPNGVAFTSETSGGNEILPAAITTSEDSYYWTVNVTEYEYSRSYTFTNASGQKIGYTSSTNFATGGNNTEWTITKETSDEEVMVPEYTGFVIRNGNTDTRAFAFKGHAFGPYATSNMGSGDYNFVLDFFMQSETVTLNGSGYATYASTNPIFFPEDGAFSAWIGTSIKDTNKGTEIHFDQITGDVSAGVGVLLTGTASEKVYLPIASTNGTAPNDNLLVGITEDTPVDAGTYYGLKGDTFKRVNAGTVPAGKALLPASEVDGISAKEFLTFVFEDDATGIENVNTNVNDNNAVIYNLAGQRISKMQKGINIVNGKKVLK